MGNIKVIHNIKEIDKILKIHWGKKASKEKPVKPKLKIVFIYHKEKNIVGGCLYAYDIHDGYFHDCMLDELVTGTEEKLNKEIATKLIKKLISYCKKEKIERIITNHQKMDKKEISLFKKLGFEIDDETLSGGYYPI